MEGFHHRSTTNFKQVNKTHKTGRHESKSAMRERAKGKIESEVPTRPSVKDVGKPSKQERKNKGKQVVQQKREQILQQKRQASNSQTPPKLIGVINLGNDEEMFNKYYNLLVQSCIDKPVDGVPIPVTCYVQAWKQRITLYPSKRNINGVMEIAKVSDILIALIPPTENAIDEKGELMISTIKAQGVPSIIGVTMDIDSINSKHRNTIKKQHKDLFEFHFADCIKYLTISNANDATQVIRFTTNHKLRDIKWRDNRPYLLVDKLNWKNNNDDNGDLLCVSGYLRGLKLNVNHIVHIPNVGDFQLLKVTRGNDPYSKRKLLENGNEMNDNKEDMNMEEEEEIIAIAKVGEQETIEEENEPDTFAAEQTWPTNDEIKESQSIRKAKKIVKRVPKGTSNYQASWILDSDEEELELDDDDENNDNDETMNDDNNNNNNNDKMTEPKEEVNYEEEEEMEEFEYLEEGGEDKSKEQYKMKKDKDSKRIEEMMEETEMEFPDEVDTPIETPARIRFQKYRGLKSFRSSPWDSKENLPMDYSRIFQFENFTKAKKRVLENREATVETGQYITLHIKGVDKSKIDNLSNEIPLIISGLLQYENKISVLNFKISKYSTYDQPIHSKETLTFHCGFRKYTVNPLFSEYNVSCDKHKYEKTIFDNRTMVASIFGQITFPPAPLLVFKEDNFNTTLVATGSLLNVNPDRIILKKIILTGYPFKIHKKYAVVRHMFFNPEDINWFRPVEVYTKYGRTGRILEALGTHGYMKVQFDSPIQQHDTICMNLYKRVFPKLSDLNK